MRNPILIQKVRYALITISLGFCVVGLFFLFAPFSVLQSLANQLAADGSAESFSLNFVVILKGIIALPTLFGIMISILLITRREKSEKIITRTLNRTARIYSGTKTDIKAILFDLHPQTGEKWYLIGLLIVTAFSVWFRYVYLWRPMAHDEAYTFVGFATRSLSYIISDYHAPNNHVFHSILTHFAYSLFGSEPWVVRFTAFLAGIAIVPSVYLAARVFYSPSIALISSSIVAYLPVMVDYSTNARGYSLIALFFVILIPIAAHVKDNKNGFGWFLLILFSILGFYTTPIMLYPAGIILLWLFLSYLMGDYSKDYGKKFPLYLAISVLLTLIIVILLYVPIILHSGLGELIGNDVVQALSWHEFTASISPRMRSTWAEWSRTLPTISVWLLIIGLLLSLFLPPRVKNRRVHFLIPMAIWPAIALTVQRVAPWPRIWVFLVPLLVIFMVAGWVGLFSKAAVFMPKPNVWAYIATCLVITGVLGAGLHRSLSYATTKMYQPGEDEKAVLFIYENYPQVNHLYAVSPDLAILDYYLLRYGMSTNLTGMDQPSSPDNSLIVINDRYGQTVESVLVKRGFKGGFSDITYEEIYHSDPIRIFVLENNPS